jgi:predicted O-methyltransferase YrrM
MIQLAPRVGAQALLPSSGSYALDVRSLAHLVDLVSAKRPALVVELGSGTSTVYLGYLLAQWGGRLVSFDHDEYYAARTRAEVARHGLEGHVEVRLAPLAEQSIGGSDALWYDLTAFEGLDAVDVLLVDGPPGHVAPKVRQHALPALIERLSPGALVLLDDAPRPDEEEIARTWREEHGFEQLEAGVSRIAVLRLP